MKIDVVGSMCTWTKELSTSFIINDEILFDVPQGSFKTLLHNYDLSKIKYVIISHFHSDHFLDLHLIIDKLLQQDPSRTLTIIAPKGCKERLCALFRIIETSYLELTISERASFIECQNNKRFKLGDYAFKTYKMLHGHLDAYGFSIEQNGVKVGFSGDTAMCNNVRKLIKSSNTCFIDSANIIENNKHLSVNEIISLKEEFSDCTIHPVHLSQKSKEVLDALKIPYPIQKQTIYI